MFKGIKKILILTVVIAIAVVTLNYSQKQITSKAEEKENDHGLNNPVTNESNVTTWDCVYFGNYPQSKYTPKKAPEIPVSGKEYTDSDGTKMVYQEWEKEEYDTKEYDYKKIKYQGYFKVEPIKWRVLSVEGDDAFLMSDSSLDAKFFNESYWVDKNSNGEQEEEEIITWKDSYIRKWLNNDFWQGAFSDEERKAIIKNTNTNKGTNDKEETNNNQFLFPDGEMTEDKVFLLSREEIGNAVYGLPDNAIGQVNRETYCTDYAKRVLEYDSQSINWWLRSPQAYYVDDGEDASYAIWVSSGTPVVEDCYGIRPVLHINLSNRCWKNANQLSIEAYKKKYEYTIEQVKVILSYMRNGSVWMKIGEEKEKLIERSQYDTREVGLSRDGVYCSIDGEGQAYYGMNYQYKGEYCAIDYLKGLNGASPWYHRTDSGEIVSSYEDAKNGIECTRFIYDEDNYVIGYETTKGDIVKWTSLEDMEALSDARWPDDEPVRTPTPTGEPSESLGEIEMDVATTKPKENFINHSNTNNLPIGTTIKDNSKAICKVVSKNTVSYVKPAKKSVKKVNIPSTITVKGTNYTVTSISKNAFAKCKKLKSVTIGKNVISIGDKAFYNCKELSKVTIPAKVTKIGKQAFANCKKMKKITIKSSKLTTKSCGVKVFKGIAQDATVKVPKKKKKVYKKLLVAKGMPKNVKIK